ncbi:hypothetical protein [Arsenicibacter rosenii]|uniref:Uncharacterized protein n=1 Tax=Arsenicibacter rosenii TaxID=1750698 RepID=A0A1S2VBK8_9BACT|nr:hypothetical protein [Arsenicibacter rosenii]OIN56137.1 hypothetical protein BLX24_26570 [Arsenicibacter rosenii]
MHWTAAQQEQLLAVISQRNTRDHIARQLAQSEALARQLDTDLRAQYDIWQREQADVDRLQRLSWASLYYDFLNRKEQQLTKEEAEARQAHARFDSINAGLEATRARCHDLQQQLTPFSTVDADYDYLIRQKQQAMASRTDETARQYQQQLDEVERLDRKQNELTEAEHAGKMLLNEVLRLNKLLAEARSRGNWDLFLNSSLISYAKYQTLDEVRDQTFAVNHRLKLFQQEYADLGRTTALNLLLTSNMTRFVDIFFDNIFTDWAVQSRIEKAQSASLSLENQLIPVLTSIQEEIIQVTASHTERLARLSGFLEQA